VSNFQFVMGVTEGKRDGMSSSANILPFLCSTIWLILLVET
jgi:hypothetical protein